MALNEYETCELIEMVFLVNMGLPYEVDRSNERRVKMIFKGDVDFIKARLQDFWDGNTRVDALAYSNDWQAVKRMLWVGGVYNPEFNKKTNARETSTKADS